LIAKTESIAVSAPYQEKIDSIDKTLLLISRRLTGVFALDARNALENEIKKVSGKLGECRQAQYKAYQMWVVDECKKAMDKYNSWAVYVSQKNAESGLYNCEACLMEIDPALLTPEVSRLYNDVLGKHFYKLDKSKSLVKAEIDFARHDKRQLTDF